MDTLALGTDHSIDFYRTIMELPAGRHLEYQCYAALDAGVGATEEDALRHEARAARYKDRGNKEGEYRWFLETNNAHYAREFMKINYSPRRLSFAALIASVDGKPVTDAAELGLEKLLVKLTSYGLTSEMIEQALESVRDTFSTELAEHFPARYNTATEELAQAVQMKRRVLALHDYFESGDMAHLKTVERIDDAMLEMMAPEVWETGDPDNALVLRRRAFGQLCGVLSEHGVPSPEELTVFQFQTRVDYVTAKIKREAPR